MLRKATIIPAFSTQPQSYSPNLPQRRGIKRTPSNLPTTCGCTPCLEEGGGQRGGGRRRMGRRLALANY